MNEDVKKARRQYGTMTFAQTVHYRLPLAAFSSLFHRVSGALLIFLLPFALYLLDKSLLSEISFEYFKGFASHWLSKLLILALVWGYLHHFCAGIRHLLMDMHVGLDKDSGRRSAVSVFVVSLSLTVLIALKLYGVF
jgi:succinate dehydrogenase / fumarate reductase cytochrome b subunit